MLLTPMLENIQDKIGLDFDGRIIKYFSVAENTFVTVGKFPISDDEFVKKSDIGPENQLKLLVAQPRGKLR